MTSPIQLDTIKTKRDSKWLLVCPECQYEREASYCQARNIINKKSSGKCKKCANRDNGILTRFKKGQSPHNKGSGFKLDRNYSKNKKQMEIVNAFGGIVFTEDILIKMRDAKIGKMEEDASNWKGGLTTENRILRSKKEVQHWRKKVLLRDEYKCRNCESQEDLHCHHIKSWSKYPELRLEKDNGITLCKTCHKKEH